MIDKLVAKGQNVPVPVSVVMALVFLYAAIRLASSCVDQFSAGGTTHAALGAAAALATLGALVGVLFFATCALRRVH